jgi:predicted metal-dependent hydrolase
MAADGLIPSAPPPSLDAIAHRRMRFDMDGEVPRYWVADSKFLTHFYNAMSVVFPAGEDFFVRSVRQYDEQIDDPTLRDQVRGFVAQEAHHNHQHRLLNAVAREQGLPMPRLERWIEAYLAVVWKVSTRRMRLALTCSLEHYTAIMGHQLLSDPSQRRAHPRMLPLWLWHAAEETEHKAVAYDVYRRVGGDYFTRVGMHLAATLTFFPIVYLMLLRLMLADRQRKTTLRDVLRGQWFLWGKPGGLRRILPALLDYFRPGFHPWDHDNRAELEAWKASAAARDHMA